MILSYLKIAIRQLMKYKVYSFVNIFGLSVGLAISIILGLYVIDDFTYDQFHENKNQIYRVLTVDNSGGKGSSLYSITSGPLILTSKEEIPEVVACTRFANGFQRISVDGKDPEKDGINAGMLITDPGFFDVFSFKIIEGNALDLNRRNAVFITPQIASTLFGDEEALGKPLETGFAKESYVAGIVEAPPKNSHIQFDIIVSLQIDRNPEWYDSWDNVLLSGYIRTQEGANPLSVENRMISIASTNGMDEVFTPKIQPLLDVHLGSADYLYDFRNQGKNDIAVVLALLIVGIVVLVIAILNFINLSSARASKRSKEVGFRKVAGSKRWQLIVQFMSESILLTIIAMLIAIVIIQVSIPKLELFLEKQLDLDFLANPISLLGLLGIAIFTGIIAGIYPSFILSSFRPIQVLKGELTKGNSGARLRSILVVFQFTITIALIIVIFSVINQVKYLESRNLGYNRENVLLVPGNIGEGEDILKNELTDLSFVKSAGRINQLPGGVFMRPEVIFEGTSREESHMAIVLSVDETLIPTMEFVIKDGRNFSKSFPSELEDGIIVNETTVRLAGWDNPIGKYIDVVVNGIERYKVVGVIKDIHYSRLRQKMEPLLLRYRPKAARRLLVRLEEGSVTEMKKEIENVYTSLYPDQEFFSVTLSEIFSNQFNQDRDFASHLGFFTAIAVLVACLGLFGLTSFVVEQRLKEIAIRKVLGSNGSKIVTLLLRDILKWIAIATLIAWPVGYFGTREWLVNFTYKAPFVIWPFIVSGLIAFIIAIITVSMQSNKAARTNPVIILRKE